MNKLKLTEDQIFELASKIFDEVNEGEDFGELYQQNSFVKNDWYKAAYDAVEGYNTVMKYVDFPVISVVNGEVKYLIQ